ncbi:unnamed protein product [Pieris macdunnoughi]|uniref:Uncharacterized protein n=1 Tax=Pieris macdunnoughi TaxID=345717 RepID=A0A821SSM1_9NEOP|nr:unnamed protein product [Pieris macdunnoughi]
MSDRQAGALTRKAVVLHRHTTLDIPQNVKSQNVSPIKGRLKIPAAPYNTGMNYHFGDPSCSSYTSRGLEVFALLAENTINMLILA